MSPSNPIHKGDSLEEAIQHAAHLLPSQGPIGVFIHHNTLHAFEHLSFEEAVVQAGNLYGCQPFMSADWYRQEYARNRIHPSDLDEVIKEETDENGTIAETISTWQFRRVLLLYPLHQVEGAGLRWHLNETGALWRFRQEVDEKTREELERQVLEWLHASPEKLTERVGFLPDEWGQQSLESLLKNHPAKTAVRALWTSCRKAIHRVDLTKLRIEDKVLVRHRDFLLNSGFGDCDSLVHPFLIRFSAAFLDQGLAERTMPGRQDGFFTSFLRLYSQKSGILPFWLQGARPVFDDILQRNLSAAECLKESLALLAVQGEELGVYLQETLLALKGWAGMIHQTQQRPDRLPLEQVPANLTDFLAVRLILERFALNWLLRGSGLNLNQTDLRASLGQPETPPVSADAWAFQLFQVAQFLGLTPQTILNHRPEQTEQIVRALFEFNDIERRRMLHLAYERRFRVRELDALTLHRPYQAKRAPSFQAIFCIDEREESTRRHLEEVAPECETFGSLGYFSVPMYFKAAHEPHPVALCPGVIQPRHLVVEIPSPDQERKAERQASVRRSIGQVEQSITRGSLSLTLGGILNFGLGLVTASPALFRVLFPWHAGRLHRGLRQRLLPSDTRLQIERDPEHQTNSEGLLLGFSIKEMSDIVSQLLTGIGLTKNFASIVLIMGHGSSSLNNPHKAAYDCGACGGAPGGPNARAFALMANHPSVRSQLSENRLVIPETTRFVGAYHNTCDDEIELYDLQDLGSEQLSQLELAVKSLQKARARDAQERCRRFASASFDLSPEAALAHVEARAEDLAQARPECGHATNASCVVGRRCRTRGLFLDRRAFLVSYDPTEDDEQGSILEGLLQTALPVGAGISLEYFFSFVDNAGYGCGTKLPHNITGMIGVMDGHASDLRTGLPWQMVEIHEPLRLLAVIETRRSVIEAIVAQDAGIRRLVANQWVQVALLDPASQEIAVLKVTKRSPLDPNCKAEFNWLPYQPEATQLPKVGDSRQWFHHHSEHLDFAEVLSDPSVATAEMNQC